MVTLKSSREIGAMRKAGLLVWEAHQIAAEMVRPGITTGEIDRAVEQFFEEQQATPLFKGVPGKIPFPAVCCISVNDEVVHGIPGDRKLREGDIITGFNGSMIDLSSDLPHMVGRTPAGEEADLTVVRNGEVISVPVLIGTLDEQELRGSRRASSQAASGNRIGITVADLEAADRRNLEGPRGVVVSQVYAGPARDAGIQRGDVITNFDGEPIDTAQQLESLIGAVPADSTVHCRIVRNKRPQFIAIRIPAE